MTRNIKEVVGRAYSILSDAISEYKPVQVFAGFSFLPRFSLSDRRPLLRKENEQKSLIFLPWAPTQTARSIRIADRGKASASLFLGPSEDQPEHLVALLNLGRIGLLELVDQVVASVAQRHEVEQHLSAETGVCPVVKYLVWGIAPDAELRKIRGRVTRLNVPPMVGGEIFTVAREPQFS